MRRLLDLLVAGLGLVVLSPLFAVIALLVKLESPGPVFFSQARVGKDEKTFRILKFRSMRVAAPQQETVETDVESMDVPATGSEMSRGSCSPSAAS